eukprot:COSAG05_NODE_17124_length_331_cov_1.077586_1_plen_37_part_10
MTRASSSRLGRQRPRRKGEEGVARQLFTMRCVPNLVH